MKMKNNLKNFIILVFLGLTIYLCFRNYNLSRKVNHLSNSIHDIPDTVYEEKRFKPATPYSQKVEPGRIKIYLPKNPRNKAVFTHNSHSDSDSSSQNTCFLVSQQEQENQNKYPLISRQDSLVQILLSKRNLNLSFYSQKSGTYSTREFKIDLEKYSYNWYQGQLTRKKKLFLNFNPYAYTQYRILNSFLDLGSGISIKTKSFNYKFGINYFNYPGLKSGMDLELRVTYNF